MKKQLKELLELALLTGNTEMVAKIQDLMAENLTWERAEQLAKQSKLTIKRGHYDDAAQLLVAMAKDEQSKNNVLALITEKKGVKNE